MFIWRITARIAELKFWVITRFWSFFSHLENPAPLHLRSWFDLVMRVVAELENSGRSEEHVLWQSQRMRMVGLTLLNANLFLDVWASHKLEARQGDLLPVKKNILNHHVMILSCYSLGQRGSALPAFPVFWCRQQSPNVRTYTLPGKFHVANLITVAILLNECLTK